MYFQDNLLQTMPRYIASYRQKGDITVAPIEERPANIYENEDFPKKIKFVLQSEKYDSAALKIKLVLPEEKTIDILNLTADCNSEISVDLKDYCRIFGVFRLEIQIFDFKNNLLQNQSLPFSHIRTGEGYFKKTGACGHFLFHDKPDSYANFVFMKKCGIRIFRDDILWENNEIEKGKPELQPNYLHTIDACRKEDIDLCLIFSYGNKFYDEGKSPRTKEGIDAFANYCKTVALLNKGYVNHYEVWNEYNLGFGQSEYDPKQYVKILKAVYTAVKSVCPEAEITAGVTCNAHPMWIKKMLEAGAYDYMDAVSLHPYCGWPDFSYPDEYQGDTEENVKSYIEIIKEYGDLKPVWISEMGWTTGALPQMATREQQAAAISRLFVITETSDVIARTTFYDFRDDGSSPFNMEHHWGLLECENALVPNAAKESYAAVSCLNCFVDGAEYNLKETNFDIKCTKYLKNSEPVNILWSLEGLKDVEIRCENDCKFADMYGNEINLSAGNHTLKIDERISYIIGSDVKILSAKKPSELLADFPFTVGVFPKIEAGTPKIGLYISSHQNGIKGQARIEVAELNICGGYKYFDLDNGGEYISFTDVAEKIDEKKQYSVLVDVLLSDGERIQRKENLSFLSISREKSDITFSLNSSDDYRYIKGEKNPEFGAGVWMYYDDKNLYIDADVYEKEHLQYCTTADRWKDIWDGSSIEVIIQPLYDGNSDITRYNHFGFALLSETNEPVAFKWHTVSGRGIGKFRHCDLRVSRNDNCTKYSVAIPFKQLLPPNIQRQDCKDFGFCFRVNNSSDDKQSLDGYLQLYSGMGSWREPNSYIPSKFGRFTLITE